VCLRRRGRVVFQCAYIPSASQIPLSDGDYASRSVFKLDLHVYEMAARVLFYIVHWLRSIKEFQTIHVKDQVRRARLLSFKS
jgi:hypothetical protein